MIFTRSSAVQVGFQQAKQTDYSFYFQNKTAAIPLGPFKNFILMYQILIILKSEVINLKVFF